MLVSVVACVSMALGVLSIAEELNISNSSKAWKETSEVIGEANSKRIDDLNATLVDFVHSLSNKLSMHFSAGC